MKQISIRHASNIMREGHRIASHASQTTQKSKELNYYPYNDINEQYVASFIDESGESEPTPLECKTKCLATAVCAYNDYDVEG